MKKISSALLLSSLTLAGSLAYIGAAQAQVAGASTTLGVSVTESTRVAAGWSAKKSILGRAVFNDAGVKVGKVEDLIVTPDKSVSYLIIGAGGFIGIGRHDVAIPISQVREISGKLVMPGATKEAVKALPEFVYADDSALRDAFVAKADKDIADAKLALTALQKKTAAATTEAKVAIDKQIAALEADIKSAQSHLDSLKHAATRRWKEFEAAVTTATDKLRKSIDGTAA